MNVCFFSGEDGGGSFVSLKDEVSALAMVNRMLTYFLPSYVQNVCIKKTRLNILNVSS